MNSRNRKATMALFLVTVLFLGIGTALAVNFINALTTNFEVGPGLANGDGSGEAGLTNIRGDGNPSNGPDWGDIMTPAGAFSPGSFGGDGAFLKDDVSAGGLNDNTVYSGGPGDKNSNIITKRTWSSSSVPAKDDISNAYAYTKIINGHKFLWVGVEREVANGDSHIDVEFYQSQVSPNNTVPCPVKQCGFIGSNTDGDLLVNMDFGNGGTFGTVSVRRRHENVTNNYDLIETLTGEGCTADSNICGFNNTATILNGGWTSFDSHANAITSLATNTFTEFGIDVTGLFNALPCFSTVEIKTRSSQSFTASLKDFSLHGFQQCSADIVTQIHDANGADITGTTIPVQTTIHDTAIVTGTIGFATPTGSVTFRKYATIDCTGTFTTEIATLTKISDPTSTTAGQAQAQTAAFTPGSGVLSYSAIYSGDANYTTPTPAADCEPLTVSRFNSAVTTDIKNGNVNGDSVLNTAVNTGTTVVDVATITGHTPTGPDPSGTVTFAVFTVGNCSGTPASTQNVTIVADSSVDGVATAISSAVTLNTATGNFLSYMVIYNGDSNYDASAASKCEPICAFPFVPGP